MQRLADAIGSTKGHLSVIENHKAGLTPAAATLIAQALGIDVGSLTSNLPGEAPSPEDEMLSIFRSATAEQRQAMLDMTRIIMGLSRRSDG